MSHNIHYSSYPIRKSQKAIQSYWDRIAAYEGRYEGACALPDKIRWINQTCASYDDAKSFIELHDGGWYDQLAVRYKERTTLPNGKKSTRTMWLVKIEYHT